MGSKNTSLLKPLPFPCRRFYKDMNAKGLEKRSNFELLE